MASRTSAVARFLFLDLAGSVIRFPAWWYTTGIARVFFDSMRPLRFRWKELRRIVKVFLCAIGILVWIAAPIVFLLLAFANVHAALV